MSKLIEINNITAGYGSHIVLRDVSLTIHQHDFIGVIGPNGGGKTTLIKVMLGLLKPIKGSVKRFDPIENKGIIGYLPQVSQIDKKFPITVIDVVLSGLLSQKKFFLQHSKNDFQKVHRLLSELGIEHLEKRSIGALSGGQLQRVFIARALISDPKLIILDEPSTFVDNQFESDLYEILRKMNDQMAILMVSHDVGTISYFVKTIACINTQLHYHPSNIISEEQLAAYNCPLQIITHGNVPHTVLKSHEHQHPHTHE